MDKPKSRILPLAAFAMMGGYVPYMDGGKSRVQTRRWQCSCGEWNKAKWIACSRCREDRTPTPREGGDRE
jgi:hypothetical protein